MVAPKEALVAALEGKAMKQLITKKSIAAYLAKQPPEREWDLESPTD